jgi:hypothetical protein
LRFARPVSTPSPLSLLNPPLPQGTQRRADWRAPSSASAFALAVASAAQRHSGLILVAARDTHGAHALEAELRVMADATCRFCTSRTGKPCPTTCSARIPTSSPSVSRRFTGCRLPAAASSWCRSQR